MGSKAAAGIAVLLVLTLGAVAVFNDWEGLGYDTSDVGEAIPFMPDQADNPIDFTENSLNGVLFEKYGAIMLVVGALMFGAMIAGVCISREEEDSDD